MAIKKTPLKVALCGMDSRSAKTMTLFLQGPCKDAAIVVQNPTEADIAIFEGDLPSSKKILEQYLQENPLKPVIVLSLWDVAQERVLYVKKPVNTENMLKVLQEAHNTIEKLKRKQLLQESLTQQPNELKEDSTKPSAGRDSADDKEVLALLNYNLVERRRGPDFIPLFPTGSKEGSGDWFDTWLESEQPLPEEE